MSRAVKAGIDPSKLEAIKSGKKMKTESGATQNKKVTVTASGDKIIAVEKEKKFEEAGVTRKKRNYVMYESKLGTEKETDLTQIKAPPKPKKLEPRPRVEEKVVMTRKKVEYLDNFQYKETKEFRKIDKGSVVVHQRLSDPITGGYEETSYQKITTMTGGDGNRPSSALKGKKTTTTTTTTRTEQKTGGDNLRSKSRGAPSNRNAGGESSASATKTMTSTTKVGRRGGAGGPTSTTTETTSKTTTTRTTRRK